MLSAGNYDTSRTPFHTLPSIRRVAPGPGSGFSFAAGTRRAACRRYSVPGTRNVLSCGVLGEFRRIAPVPDRPAAGTANELVSARGGWQNASNPLIRNRRFSAQLGKNRSKINASS